MKRLQLHHELHTPSFPKARGCHGAGHYLRGVPASARDVGAWLLGASLLLARSEVFVARAIHVFWSLPSIPYRIVQRVHTTPSVAALLLEVDWGLGPLCGRSSKCVVIRDVLFTCWIFVLSFLLLLILCL